MSENRLSGCVEKTDQNVWDKAYDACICVKVGFIRFKSSGLILRTYSKSG